MDGCAPRGESMLRVRRSMDALLFGAVGFVGMAYSPETMGVPLQA